MKHIWSLICERSSIDSQTNLLSIFNCIEEVSLEIDKTKIPDGDKLVVPANIQLISLWTSENFTEENSTEIKVEFIDPNGKILTEFINVLKTKKGEKRLRSLVGMQGLQVTDGGRYYYKIYQKNNNKFEVITELPFDINLSYKN